MKSIMSENGTGQSPLRSSGSRITNRDRIIKASITLFNKSGVSTITTNHIAAHLKISPGNLYYHFRNKEEILRVLFDLMAEDVENLWSRELTPDQFFKESFDVFWKFRFFHRELYHLRRQDPQLTRKWRKHLDMCWKLLNDQFTLWNENGTLREGVEQSDIDHLVTAVFASVSPFLQLYESGLKDPSKKGLEQGIEYMKWLFRPYLDDKAGMPKD